MYKIHDYVIEVHITGLDPIPNSPLHTGGSVLVSYSKGPQSRFALRSSTASKRQIKDEVLFCARGEVLDAIERVQRRKDGEPAWLLAAKQEAAKAQEAREQRARIAAWQAANPIR